MESTHILLVVVTHLKLTTSPTSENMSFSCSSVASYGILPTTKKKGGSIHKKKKKKYGDINNAGGGTPSPFTSSASLATQHQHVAKRPYGYVCVTRMSHSFVSYAFNKAATRDTNSPKTERNERSTAGSLLAAAAATAAARFAMLVTDTSVTPGNTRIKKK